MVQQRFLAIVLLVSFLFGGKPVLVHAQDLSSQSIADISRAATVQIGTHVFGKVKIPRVTVDARARTIAVVPESEQEVVIDEYLVGSGFVFQENGYIATNAHVVSTQTLKQKLVSEKALAALYENALILSDAELENLLNEGKNGFLQNVFTTILEQSTIELNREVRVLDPNRAAQTIPEAMNQGQNAAVLSESPNFLSGGADIALLKIDVVPAPSLGFATREVVVGDRVYIAGYPSTAETSERSSGESTFTSGVVSAVRLSSDGRQIYQTDAKVSEGSSGGPVLNAEGKVIGIVTSQTDVLARKSGDNFAFAQAIESVTEIARAARIEPSEGMFVGAFRSGFQAYIDRRCNEMEQAFGGIQGIHPFYKIERSLVSYRQDCALWQAEGSARDSQLDMWQGMILNQKDSFWWLFLGSGIFVGAIIILVLWLFRQLERDEKEIARLGKRIVQDEQEILRQQKMAQQWFLEHDQKTEHSSGMKTPL